jgi:hypothetical protein
MRRITEKDQKIVLIVSERFDVGLFFVDKAATAVKPDHRG